MNVTKRKKININKTRKNVPKKIIIGRIYAHWCGYCKLLKPEWKNMKNQIKLKLKSIPNTRVYYINIEQKNENEKVDKVNRMYLENSDEKLISKGYPTLFRIENGKLEYYNGERNANKMEDFYLYGGNSYIHGGNNTKTKKNKSSLLSFFGF